MANTLNKNAEWPVLVRSSNFKTWTKLGQKFAFRGEAVSQSRSRVVTMPFIVSLPIPIYAPLTALYLPKSIYIFPQIELKKK